MEEEKLVASTNSNNEENIKLVTTDLKPDSTATPSLRQNARRPRARVNSRIMQNYLLIWLDPSIDEINNDSYTNTVAQLRRIVNYIETFSDADSCIDFMNHIENERIFFIVSGYIGEYIMPTIHKVSHLDSIYILCTKKSRHEQWATKWPKINGVFTELSLVCAALKQAVQDCENSFTSITFMSVSGDTSSARNLNQMDSSYMYTQILKEILLQIKFEEKHFQEFIDYCKEQFANNVYELSNVEKLEQEYRDRTPIWWYTYESFLYPMLNRALRTMEVDIIIKMGFFIDDLYRHIDDLHTEQFGDMLSKQSFVVYRGQGLSQTDFNQMMQTKGGLMSFNSFLSTSKNREVSLDFVHRILWNQDLVGILFVMSIDPSISSTPFASITDVSYCENVEDEVLFSMHTVFRIGDIKQVDEKNRLWQVHLTLTSDNDQELQDLTEFMREETEGSTGWDRLGELLFKLGQANKAEQVYEAMLEQAVDDRERAYLYHQLGRAKRRQGNYEEAITFMEKALESEKDTLPPNHPDLAYAYNNIGVVYMNLGDYSKALLSHEKALEIRKESLPQNHLDLAMSYDNIGLVYVHLGEYTKALSSHKDAFEIEQKYLPPNHPRLAASYNNIGNVYKTIEEYSEALPYYEKALEIDKRTLPPNHPDLALSYENIGSVYAETGDYSKALQIKEKTLSLNHPDLASLHNNLGNLYYNMGEYSKSLLSYEKEHEIYQKILPPNHSSFAVSYNDIGNAYKNMGEYSKALSAHDKALQIKEETVPLNHADLALSYNNIGNVYYMMDDYSKAISFYERAADTGQYSLPPDHPSLEMYRNNLELVKSSCNE